MSIIDSLLTAFARKKLGADFEERVMERLESQNCGKDETIREIIGHYEGILQLIAPDYQSVKLKEEDLLTLCIDNVEHSLGDKSSAKGRKAAEHRMAVECLLADLGEDGSGVIAQVEEHLNRK